MLKRLCVAVGVAVSVAWPGIGEAQTASAERTLLLALIDALTQQIEMLQVELERREGAPGNSPVPKRFAGCGRAHQCRCAPHLS